MPLRHTHGSTILTARVAQMVLTARVAQMEQELARPHQQLRKTQELVTTKVVARRQRLRILLLTQAPEVAITIQEDLMKDNAARAGKLRIKS